MKHLTLLSNAQIKHLAPDYLKTVLYSKRNQMNFMGEHITITMKYRIGKKNHLLFKVSNVKVNSVDDIVKTINYYIDNLDKNLKYDKVYLNFIAPKNT